MKKISEKLYVGPQMRADDFGRARDKGITAIINNRPDGEEAGQPSAAENTRAASAAGLGYTHIPVVSGQIEEAHVRAFQKAVAAAPGAVFAHCRSGTRSAALHAIGEVLDGRLSKADVIPLGQTIGIDLSGAVRWLDARGY